MFEHENTRVNFDIVHLSQTHPSCKYLSGLLDMFKEKFPYEYTEPATVSVRFTYNLKQFPTSSYIPKRKFAFSDRQEDYYSSSSVDFQLKPNTILPFGVSVDPIYELVLYCTWLEVAENVVMDSRNYSDFDPMLAPKWSFRLHYDATPNTFMRECLFEFLQQCDSRKTLAELIGAEYAYSATADVSCCDESKNPLERLTVSKISKITSSVLSAALSTDTQSKKAAATKKKPLEGPLKDDQLMTMLYYLFPDATESNNATEPYKIPTMDNVSQTKPE